MLQCLLEVGRVRLQSRKQPRAVLTRNSNARANGSSEGGVKNGRQPERMAARVAVPEYFRAASDILRDIAR